MNDITKSRFSDAPWYIKAQEMAISVVGAGGTGSFTIFYLGRIGFDRILIFDDDIVEEVNLAGQLYNYDDISNFKAEAMKKMLKTHSSVQMNNVTISTFKYKNQILNPVTFSCVDNMKARQFMFANWLDINKGKSDAIFIDQRLNLEQLQVFCVQADDEKSIELFKEKYLFDDSEITDPICTLKQTTFAAGTIAGITVGFYTNFLANLAHKNKSRIVPFFTEYFSPLNLMTNEPA